MKNDKINANYLILCLLFLFILVLSSCSKEREESAVEQASRQAEEETIDPPPIWDIDTKEESLTLMIYMIGSDLESGSAAASSDLDEIADNELDYEKIHVIVYTGGSQKWHNGFPNDANALYHLTASGFQQLDSFETTSMGSAETLAGFLDYGYENYPADNYALILWDHGNGPLIGYGMDRLYNNDTLTLSEIKEGLSASPFGEEKEAGKLNFIGFDACLMSSVELACSVSDYADYLVASQEIEPNFGWNYDFLDRLGKIDSQAMVAKITHSFLTYCNNYYEEKAFFRSDVTLASMDLSYAQDLRDALNKVFRRAADDVSGDYMELAVERVKSRELGRSSTGSQYDLVDVRDLINCMEERYPGECQAVGTILEKMMVSNDTNTENVCGISIYYPYYNKNYYKNSWKDTYKELGLFPDYITYLSRYEKIWLGTSLKELFEDKLIPKEGSDGSFTLTLSEEQEKAFAKAGYYVMRRTGEDLYQPVYFSRNISLEDGVLTAHFDGNVIYVKHPNGKFIPLIIEQDTIGDLTYYATYPRVENIASNSMMTDMTLTLDRQTGEIEIKSFTESANDGRAFESGKKNPINPENWQLIAFHDLQAAYLERDERDLIKPFSQWTKGDWYTGHEISLKDDFEFVYEPIYDDGNEYYIMFTVADLQNNNYSSELLPISLAKAPAKEEEVPINLSLEEDMDGEVLLCDKENVTISFVIGKNYESGKTQYYFTIDNQNDFDTELVLKDCVVNGKYSVCRDRSYMVKARKKKIVEFNDLEKLSMDMEEERIKDLDFHLYLMNYSRYVTIDSSKLYHISFSEDLIAKDKWYPYHGALLQENQIIYDKNDVKLTLLKGGYYLGSDYNGPDDASGEMTLSLLLENNSEQDYVIALDGCKINDLYYRKSRACQLAAGMKKVMILSFSDFKSLDLLARIQGEDRFSIGGRMEMRIRLQSEEEKEAQVSWLNLKFASKAFRPTSIPKGELLFENDDLEIYKLGHEKIVKDASTGKSNQSWLLSIVNKSEKEFHFRADYENSSINGIAVSDHSNGYFYAGGSSILLPDTRGLFLMEISNIRDFQQLKTRIEWSENLYWDEYPVYHTEEIVLNEEE